MFSQGLSREVGARGITVNTIQPGPIDTDLNPAAGDWATPQIANTALGRYGQVDDIAAMAAFLAGPQASYITGREPHRRRRNQRVRGEDMSICNGKTALVTGASRGIGRARRNGPGGGRRPGPRPLWPWRPPRPRPSSRRSSPRAARAEAVGADLSAPQGAHALGRPRAGPDRRRAARHPGRQRRRLQGRDHSRRPRWRTSTPSSPVNVRANYFLVQQLLPILKEGVERPSSPLRSPAHAAVGNLSAYAATKGAVDTLVKHFAFILGPRGVCVGERSRARRGGDRHVELRRDRGGARLHPRHAGAEARGPTRRHRRRHPAFLASDAARWVSGDTLPRGRRLQAVGPRR